MSVDPQYILVGMNVVGSDGEQVGTVKEVGATEILVDRPLARDVYVPLEAIQAIMDAIGLARGGPARHPDHPR